MQKRGDTLRVIDLEGNEYPVQATTTNDIELNGNQFITGRIVSNKVNDLFINNLDKMWNIVDHDNVEHKIVYARKRGVGKRLTVEIKGIPILFDTLNRQRIYERYDERMTAQVAFSRIFQGTGFNFVLVDSFTAVEWEGFGDGETKMSTFQRALNRYEAEFEIQGNTVYIKKLVGQDTDNMYRHRLNASNIVKEIDAQNMWTYARGYGNYEDGDGWENAKLIREYTSPLASIPGIGIRHAPPIKDGRIKNASEMDERLQKLVDESLIISVSATIHQLKRQNYPIAYSNVGDRVFLIDERIGLNEKVRVVHQTITRDWRGNIIDINITFGSPGIVKRHQAQMKTAIKQINNLFEGRVELPYNVMPNAVRLASEALRNAMTELEIGSDGIIARDPTNPNRLVLFNSAGLGISLDGGITFEEAITYLGINTNLLTAGQIHTNNIKIIGRNNLFFWDGNELKAIDPNDSGKYVKMTSGMLEVAKGAIRIKRPDGYTVINDGMLNTDFSVQFSPTPHYSTGAEPEGYYVKTSSTSPRIIANGRFRRDGRYLKLILGLWTTTPGETARMRVRSQGTNPTIYATTTETSQDGGFESAQRTITVDLGTPNGSRTSFYVELYSTNGNEVRGYVHSAWLEG